MAAERAPLQTEARRRMQYLAEKHGIGWPEDFAKSIGFEVAAVRKWMQRDSIPKAGAIAISQRYGVTPGWVLCGEGEAHDAGELPPAPPCTAHHDSALVDEIDVRAGMGGGGIAAMECATTDEYGNTIQCDSVKAVWTMPKAFMAHTLGVSPSNAKIIEVQGDSMEPTLRPGDRVMIDTSDKRPSPPGIFAIWDGIGVVVKRIEPILGNDDGALRVISDNSHHSVYECPLCDAQIIGRVVWFSRRV